MSLPASLLTAIETHSCFTGSYDRGSAVTLAVDPTRGAVRSLDASCDDCLSFRVGTLASLLPAGYDEYQLAKDLSAHMLKVRGYTWAIGGYHVSRGNNPGFWVSAASFGNGVLLVNASRNSGKGTDLDYLLQAFQTHLATPEDPGMLDPRHYSVQTVYLDLSSPLGPVHSRQDILSSRQCSLVPHFGHHRVTVLEYLPLVQAARVPPLSAPPAPLSAPPAPVSPAPAPARPRALGERCPECGAEVMRRQLLTEFFVGCMC